MNKPSRQVRRQIYKLTWEQIDELIKDNYEQGFKDGTEVAGNADLKIKLVQVLKNTKGVGDKTFNKILNTFKEMEVEDE